MVAGWVAIISVSHIPCYSLLIYSLLLAHWASHAHYSLSFLSPCSHFSHQDKGPFSVCIHYLRVPWALDLGARSSHYLFSSLHHCIPSYLIGYVLHLFFFILSTACFASYSFHLEWWSSSIHYMEGSHIITIIYPKNTGSKILRLRRSSCQREFCFLSARERVYALLISSLGLILFMFRVCTFVYM